MSKSSMIMLGMLIGERWGNPGMGKFVYSYKLSRSRFKMPSGNARGSKRLFYQTALLTKCVKKSRAISGKKFDAL